VLEPDDDDLQPIDNSLINSYTSGPSLGELPLEKRFTQSLFKQQIENISLDQAKELLLSIHELYLAQQHVASLMAKQDLLGWRHTHDNK